MEKLTSGDWDNDGEILFSHIVPGKGIPFNMNIEISSTSLYFTIVPASIFLSFLMNISIFLKKFTWKTGAFCPK